MHHALKSHDHILALRLYDDLNNTDPLAYEDAKFFREIFPDITLLPYLMILNPEGNPVAQLEGYEVAERVEDSLSEVSNNHKPEVRKIPQISMVSSNSLDSSGPELLAALPSTC